LKFADSRLSASKRMAMDNEELMATLAQSMRQMRDSSKQKVRRLREIEAEAESLRQEIEMLDSSANQIETTMHSLFFAKRSQARNDARQYAEMNEPDFDQHDLADILSKLTNKAVSSSKSYAPPQRSVVPMRHDTGRHVIPPINPDIEIKSHRFSDRTITQACTILMREAGRPLHVNEVYNRLLEHGFEFTGNNPTISIAVSLNRNRRFRKVAPGTFDLVMRDASQAAS